MEAQKAAFRMTLHIKRKATGKVDTYDLVGIENNNKMENKDGSNSHDSSSEHSGEPNR